jgi:hypothetical protein
MSKSSAVVLEVLVNIFFFSAVFVGIAVYLKPNSFQDVLIASKPANSVSGHSSGAAPRVSLEQELIGAVSKFNVFDISYYLIVLFII